VSFICRFPASLLPVSSTGTNGTWLLLTAMAETATSGLALCLPPRRLPLQHPMAETREAQAETEEPGSEGPQAVFPLREHTGDEKNSAAADRVSSRTRSRDY